LGDPLVVLEEVQQVGVLGEVVLEGVVPEGVELEEDSPTVFKCGSRIASSDIVHSHTGYFRS
jgi:hypothetical protein